MANSGDGTAASRWRGAALAMGAAVLFGASTPAAKLLLGQIDPWLLAAILYLGSGAGLCTMRILQRAVAPDAGRQTALHGEDWGWFSGAILAGGVIGPVLLMIGLSRSSAASTLAPAQSRIGGDRPGGLVRLSREFRPADRPGHGGNCGWGCGAFLAGQPVSRRSPWPAGDCRGLSCLGHRQQPDPQGLTQRSRPDRDVEGAGRGLDQSGSGTVARRDLAGPGRNPCRCSYRSAGLWREPGAVRLRPAVHRHGAHRRLFRHGTLYRRDGRIRRAGRARHLAVRVRGAVDGGRSLAAFDRAP